MKKFGKKVVLALALAVSLGVGAGSTAEAATKYVKSVKVADPVTGSTKTVYLAKKKSKTLKTTVTVTKSKYNKSKYKKLTFKTNKKSVATVNSKGKITGKKAGKAKITVTSKYNKKKKTITVQVLKGQAKSVSLNEKSLDLKVGGTATLKATVKGTKGVKKTVGWKSSNSKVATVDSKGKVTAKGVGTATITATAADGTKKKATCTVTVKAADVAVTTVDVTGVTVNPNTVSVVEGASATVTATVAPASATDKTLTVSSSNTAAATATVSGSTVTIKGVKAGDAVVTVKSNNGKTATVTVKVTAKASDEPTPEKVTYTKITPVDGNVDVKVYVDFQGTDSDREKAIEKLEKYVGLALTSNSNKVKSVTIDGKEYAAKFENDSIFVNGKKLSETAMTDGYVEVTVGTNARTALMGLSLVDDTFPYTVTIGDFKFRDAQASNGKLNVTINGKNYTDVTITNGVVEIKGNYKADFKDLNTKYATVTTIEK